MRGRERDCCGAPARGAAGGALRSRGAGLGLPAVLCHPARSSLLSSAELSQVEITRTYLAKQADEISLQQADVVLVLGGEDGTCQPAGTCGRGRLTPSAG